MDVIDIIHQVANDHHAGVRMRHALGLRFAQQRANLLFPLSPSDLAIKLRTFDLELRTLLHQQNSPIDFLALGFQHHKIKSRTQQLARMIGAVPGHGVNTGAL